MTNYSRTVNSQIESLSPTARIGLGTTGGETASLVTRREVECLLNLAGLNGDSRERARGMLMRVFPVLVLDSGVAKSRELRPTFAGDEPERTEFPASYRRLSCPGGQELLDGADEPPNRHMRRFLQARAELVQRKSANSEAQSSRLYGAVNAYADILRIDRRIKMMLRQLRDISNDPAWGALVELGFPLADDTFFVEVIGSGAGGQATSLFVTALVLLNKRLPLSRSSYKIVVDFLSPGFLPAPNEAVSTDQQVKSKRVLNDLAALKAGGIVEIPHPHGALSFGGAGARDAFDEIYFHVPRPSSSDALGSFVSSTADLIVDRSIGPYANEWRTSVSNDPYLVSVPEMFDMAMVLKGEDEPNVD